ncbi:hypothetical protein RAA17_06520 [Komagataeibacter rhaeticus]|nr:hypothetical protein [Komagataeibacter rhaeticus]
MPSGLRLTPARQKVLELATTALPTAELARRAGVGAAVICGLAQAGALTAVEILPLPFALPDPAHCPRNWRASRPRSQPSCAHGWTKTVFPSPCSKG